MRSSKRLGEGRLLVRLAGLVVVAGADVRAQEIRPTVDPLVPKLEAQTPTDFAHFGYTGGAGRLRGVLDTRDDVVISAIDEGEGGHDSVGAAFVFEDNLLSPPLVGSRLVPMDPLNDDMNLARLSVVE